MEADFRALVHGPFLSSIEPPSFKLDNTLGRGLQQSQQPGLVSSRLRLETSRYLKVGFVVKDKIGRVSDVRASSEV